MPTSRELKQLLKPLLARRPELAFSGRTLFFAPFTHYLRGVEFVGFWTTSAARADSFARALYDGYTGTRSGLTPQPYSYRMPEDWKDDLAKTSQELCEALEQHALPPVEPIISHSEHLKSTTYMISPGPTANRPYHHPEYALAIAIGECTTTGSYDFAEEILAESMKRFSDYPPELATEEHKHDIYFGWRAAYLLRLLQTDRPKVIPLLHDWEAYAVNALKLTRYWKPTPFACEL
jgi:hypothetical protein